MPWQQRRGRPARRQRRRSRVASFRCIHYVKVLFQYNDRNGDSIIIKSNSDDFSTLCVELNLARPYCSEGPRRTYHPAGVSAQDSRCICRGVPGARGRGRGGGGGTSWEQLLGCLAAHPTMALSDRKREATSRSRSAHHMRSVKRPTRTSLSVVPLPRASPLPQVTAAQNCDLGQQWRPDMHSTAVCLINAEAPAGNPNTRQGVSRNPMVNIYKGGLGETCTSRSTGTIVRQKRAGARKGFW